MKITNIMVLRVKCVSVLFMHSNFLLIKNLFENFSMFNMLDESHFSESHLLFMLRSGFS